MDSKEPSVWLVVALVWFHSYNSRCYNIASFPYLQSKTKGRSGMGGYMCDVSSVHVLVDRLGFTCLQIHGSFWDVANSVALVGYNFNQIPVSLTLLV